MVQMMRKREPLAFFQPTFCAVPTFGAVILHSVNVPFLPVQAEGDDEHAEALVKRLPLKRVGEFVRAGGGLSRPR